MRGAPLRAPQGLATALAQESWPSSGEYTNELRNSIVRIQKIETVIDWFEPYGESSQSVSVGTGFAATLVAENGCPMPPDADKDPVFITNAHVVENAEMVKIQFPAIGQEEFDGYVPVIYEDHDIAVVKLIEPEPFADYLKQKNVTLRALPIRKHEEVMGMNVVAIGFPLGSSTLKLSTGVLAGTELVDGMTVLQSTAPISPGNSGGPLLDLGDALSGQAGPPMEAHVIGVTFAATTSEGAENVNYVIPAVHVRQALRMFLALESNSSLQQGDTGAGPSGSHASMKLAPIGALPVHTNEALYKLGGCKEGVFISNVAERSALSYANPRVEPMSFITAVDGTSIDSFGLGRMQSGFLGDPLPFQSLMQIKESTDDPVELTTCKDGKASRHTVSMAATPEHESGIRWVREPLFEPWALDYEVFADVAVMQMTLNHVSALMQAGVSPSYGRWLLGANAVQPRLLVVKVEAGTYASTVLAPGMVIASINGHNVSTLEEFRKYFEPKDDLWRLTTERGSMYVVSFNASLASQLDMYRQGRSYVLTTAIVGIAQQRGIIKDTTQQATAMQFADMFSQMLEDAYAKGQASAESGSGSQGRSSSRDEHSSGSSSSSSSSGSSSSSNSSNSSSNSSSSSRTNSTIKVSLLHMKAPKMQKAKVPKVRKAGPVSFRLPHPATPQVKSSMAQHSRALKNLGQLL